MQDYRNLPGAIASHAREYGYTLVAGAPIVVDRRVWGLVLTMSQRPQVPDPQDLEERLAEFTELVATAIGNSEARDNLARIGEEQAALRRVATCVADGAKPNDVFAAIADEVAAMFDVPIAVMVRYDPGGMATVLASVGPGFSPVGGRFPVETPSVTAAVFQAGKSVHIDDWADIDDPAAALARENGVRWAVGVPIVVDGALWGLIAVAAPDTVGAASEVEDRLRKFTELLATAISNAESRAQLEASRARIVATADATRRRIERDLHDGAQQQLVSLALELRAVQANVPAEFEQHRAELSHVVEGLTGVLDELREIALGIHPGGLSEGGLVDALGTLARRSLVPVQLDLRFEGRLPETVEVTAYYVVSEALTNAAKYAHATAVDVLLEVGDGDLHVTVRDDGCGGADPRRGSGLLGLRDRVEATGGTMRLTSPPGSGTHLSILLPLGDRT